MLLQHRLYIEINICRAYFTNNKTYSICALYNYYVLYWSVQAQKQTVWYINLISCENICSHKLLVVNLHSIKNYGNWSFFCRLWFTIIMDIIASDNINLDTVLFENCFGYSSHRRLSRHNLVPCGCWMNGRGIFVIVHCYAAVTVLGCAGRYTPCLNEYNGDNILILWYRHFSLRATSSAAMTCPAKRMPSSNI